MAAKSLARGLNQELTCAVCLELFNTPKALPCLHTFCEECLQGVLQGSDKSKGVVECPTCRTQHDLSPKGVEGFTTNFTAINLIELLSSRKNGNGTAPLAAVLKCENEIDDNPAATKCLNCNFFLCDECSADHKKHRATKTHKIVTLSELRKKGAKQLERKHHCIDHEGEELKLYCRTCKEVICRDCTIVTHKQHDYTFIKDIKKELTQEMQNLLGCMEEKVEKFTQHQNHLQEVDRKSKESINACRSKVQEYFKERHRRLEEREGQLLCQLDQHLKVASKQMDTENSTVELYKVQITSAVEFTQQLLSNGEQYDIAMMSKQTCEQLKHVQTLHWNPDSVSPCIITFDSLKEILTSAKIAPFNSDHIIVEGLDQPLYGRKTFTVRLNEEVNSVINELPVVSIEEERTINVLVKANGQNQWIASCTIPQTKLLRLYYKITVSIAGVEAKREVRHALGMTH